MLVRQPVVTRQSAVPVAASRRHPRVGSSQRSKLSCSTYAKGLGYVETPRGGDTRSSKLARRVDFPDGYYALIAVMSGWIPMIVTLTYSRPPLLDVIERPSNCKSCVDSVQQCLTQPDWQIPEPNPNPATTTNKILRLRALAYPRIRLTHGVRVVLVY
jgi:hypothetical protein